MPVAAGGLTAPTLPELVTVGCQHCTDGCEVCNGTAEREVCGGCGETPNAATDACACTLTVSSPTVPCETCDRLTNAATLTDGICPICFAEGVAILRHEAEEYQAWVVEQIGGVPPGHVTITFR